MSLTSHKFFTFFIFLLNKRYSNNKSLELKLLDIIILSKVGIEPTMNKFNRFTVYRQTIQPLTRKIPTIGLEPIPLRTRF